MNLDHIQVQLRKATQEWASIFSHLPWQRWWRSAPKILEVVLVVLLAKAAADLTWLIFAPSDEVGPAMNVAPITRAPVAEVARLNSVANLHLFGIPSKLTTAQGAQIDAQETGLQLTLRGVFASNEPQQSMAIVADQQQNEKVYVRGDAVVAGVTLYEVYPDRIILERSGNYETLTMPRDSKDKPSVITPVARTQANTRIAPQSAGNAISAGESLKVMRENLVNQPKKFWDQVRIDPVADPGTGQLRGFRFNHRDPQVLQSMGLRPDDVIMEVNGLPATDPSVLQNLMNMQGNQELRIGVERQGRREELRISM